MIVSERIFIDTAPFIYLTENNPIYYPIVSHYINEQFSINESFLFTSTMTVAEFLVKPKLHADNKTIEIFYSTLANLNVFVSDITREIAEKSADVRAKYGFLKAVDSVQLAVALTLNCTVLFTNDKVFKRVKEINVVLVDGLSL